MARGRMITKTLSTSRKFAKLASEFGQVLYMLIIPHCDDFGRQSGDAFTVKHQVFPTSPRTEDEFEAALVDMEGAALIERYDVADEKILQVVQFEEHQVGLHKRSNSRFPENPGTSGKFPEIPSELKGTEGNRTEGNGALRSLISGESSPKGWGKIHGDHVAGFCDWVCLPEFVFNEFVRKSSGADYVRQWAAGVRAKHEGQTVGDNLKFWRNRWAEAHPEAPVTGKPKVRSVDEIKRSMGLA